MQSIPCRGESTVTEGLQTEEDSATALRILVAEDDPTSEAFLTGTLRAWGHEVIVVGDGVSALEMLESENPPEVAILDWMMPEPSGPEVCRKVRATDRLKHLYLIILTARDSSDAIAEALNAGADDFVSKPFEPKELKARLAVGERILSLQSELAGRVEELQTALDQVTQLQGLLPICSYCSKVRDDGDYWQGVERYLERHADVRFSHSICPDCFDSVAMKELEDANRAFGQEG